MSATNSSVRRRQSASVYAPQKQQFASPTFVHGSRPRFGLERMAQAMGAGTGWGGGTGAGGITTTAAGFYAPQHTPSAWQIPTNRKEVYAWCLHPDTLITMSDFTQKKLCDVEIGDEVLTGDGTNGKVTVKSSRPFNGKLKRIETTGHINEILSTPEHPFFVVEEEKLKCKYFTSTFRMCREKYACQAKHCNQYQKIEEDVDLTKKIAGELQVGDFLYTPTNILNGTREDFSTGLMRLFGYYLAEGYVAIRQNRKTEFARVGFSFGEKEKEDLVKDAVKIIKQEFDYDAKINTRMSVSTVSIYNVEIAKQFYDIFGTGSSIKIIPDIILQQKPELLRELVIGYLLGDGNRKPDGRAALTSINYDLLMQIRYILWGLGISSVMTGAKKEEGKHQRGIYHRITINATDSNKLFKDSIHNNSKTIEITKTKNNKQSFTMNDKELHRIISIEDEEYSGPVYDLRVDNISGSHSFVAEFCTVSNCKYWIQNEPYVAVGLDFYANFAMNGFKLECPNGAIREYFEKLCRETLDFDKWLPKIAHEYFSYGDCFAMCEMKCGHCHGTGTDEKTQRPCTHEGATWTGISIFDPNTIEVTPSGLFSGSGDVINWIPNDQLVEICTKGKPEAIYNQIPPAIREQIKAKQPISLNPIAVTHLKCGNATYETYGTSLIRRLFPILAYRDKLRQAQWIVAERHILPIKYVKVGSDTRPASDDDLAAVEEQFAQLANDPLITLILHHAVEIDYVGAAGKVLQLTNEYEMISDEILGGMQMNKALVHGEGPNYSSAQVGLDALAARLQSFRNEMKSWIEQKIFKPIAEWNNFTSPSLKGIDEIIYPHIVFNDMGLKDNNQEIANLLQLRARNEISLQTLLSKFDIDYDDEVEKLRQEEMGNMLTSPEIGVGVEEGGDMGGGMLPMGGGAMPPMGGGAMPPMGGEAPAGGAPGAEAGAAGAMPPPTAMGSVRMEKGASTGLGTMEMVRMRRESVVEFETIMDKYAESEFSDITGRGYLGLINKEADYVEMDPDWLPYMETGADLSKMVTLARTDKFIAGKYSNFLEKLASKNNKNKQNNNYKRYFNQAEMTLFDAIVQANQKGQIPLAFVAQYFVGSNPNLVVDGAFPGVKVAIEVDGETWHHNDEQMQRDMRKDNTLWSLGWIVLRFTEDEVKEKIGQVIKVIQRVTSERASGNKN